jgi:hypothetical protein
MESSYLEILNSTASTYQKFGNVYRKISGTTRLKKEQKVITVSL